MIYVNGKFFDVAVHYASRGAPLPSTPTMTVCEIAGAGGLWGCKSTYRKDGSIVTNQQDYCVVLCDERGHWEEPVWTLAKHCNTAIPLTDYMCFAAFPEGTY